MNQLSIYFNLRKKVCSIYVHGITLSADRASTLCAKFQPEDQNLEAHGLKLTKTDLNFVSYKNKLINLSIIQFLKYFDYKSGKFCFKGYELDVDDGFYQVHSSKILDLQNELANYISSNRCSSFSKSSNILQDNKLSKKQFSSLNSTDDVFSNQLSLHSVNEFSKQQQNSSLSINNLVQQRVEGLVELNDLFENKLRELNRLRNMEPSFQPNSNNQNLEKFPLPNLIDLESNLLSDHSKLTHQSAQSKIEVISPNSKLDSDYLAKSHNIDENEASFQANNASDLLEKQ